MDRNSTITDATLTVDAIAIWVLCLVVAAPFLVGMQMYRLALAQKESELEQTKNGLMEMMGIVAALSKDETDDDEEEDEEDEDGEEEEENGEEDEEDEDEDEDEDGDGDEDEDEDEEDEERDHSRVARVNKRAINPAFLPTRRFPASLQDRRLGKKEEEGTKKTGKANKDDEQHENSQKGADNDPEAEEKEWKSDWSNVWGFEFGH